MERRNFLLGLFGGAVGLALESSRVYSFPSSLGRVRPSILLTGPSGVLPVREFDEARGAFTVPEGHTFVVTGVEYIRRPWPGEGFSPVRVQRSWESFHLRPETTLDVILNVDVRSEGSHRLRPSDLAT